MFDYEEYIKKTRKAESGGNDRAKNIRSSATGRYQFIKSTWEGLGFDWKDRFDPNKQEQAMKKFTMQNVDYFRNVFKTDPTDSDVYGMHFLGNAGYTKIKKADNNMLVRDILSADVIRANPFLQNMSKADFERWLGSKQTPSKISESLYEENERAVIGNYITPEKILESNLGEGFEVILPDYNKEEDRSKINQAKSDILKSELEDMQNIVQQSQVTQINTEPTYNYLQDTNLFRI